MAARADTKELQPVADLRVPHFFDHLIELLEDAVVEAFGFVAGTADDVVMMVTALELVPGDLVTEVTATDDSGLLESRHTAVNGDEIDLLFGRPVMELFDAKRAVFGSEDRQESFTRFGPAKAGTF